MLKLLVSSLVLASALGASETLTTFLKQRIGSNPNIQKLEVNVKREIKLDEPKGFTGVIVELKGVANTANGPQPFSERGIYFVNGSVMAPDLVDLKTGQSMKNSLAPTVEAKHYDKSRLVFGNENAKHKIVIFSDPLCPYCQRSIPPLLDYVKKYPKTFAVYYYHLPLERIHPAAVTLTKAMTVATNKGNPDAIARGYSAKVGAKEGSNKVILEAFNRATGMKLELKDVLNADVSKHLEHDREVATELMVNSTPTIFFDGKKDVSREAYKHVKTVD